MPVIAFLTSIIYVPGIPSGITSPRWWVIGVGSAIALLFLRIHVTRWHIIGAAFLAYCAASVTWALSPPQAMDALFHLTALAAVFMFAAEHEDLTPTWIALGLGVTVNLVVALAQVSGYWAWSQGVANDIPVGLMGNKNFLGGFAAVVAIGLLTCRTSRLTSVLVMLCSLCVMITTSRGAGLAFLVALMCWLSWSRRAAIIALAALLIAVDLWVLPARMSSIDVRMDIWETTLANLKLFGWGVGNYGTVFSFDHASNDILETVFELGVGATALVILGWLAFIQSTEKAPLVAIIVLGCTASVLYNPATAFVAAVVAGRLARVHRDAFAAQRARRVHGESRLTRANVAERTGFPPSHSTTHLSLRPQH